MTTRLTLICHAPTAATRTAAFPMDEPLDHPALQKLTALSGRPHRADRFWTSPALRAVRTAEAPNIAATPDPALRDCDYGRWAGRSLVEIQAREPDAVAEWLQDPAAAPHGGESLIALIERVGAWLGRQIETPGKVTAITHASVIRAAIIRAIEADARSFRRIDIAPLSYVRLSASGAGWVLSSISPGKAEAEPS